MSTTEDLRSTRLRLKAAIADLGAAEVPLHESSRMGDEIRGEIRAAFSLIEDLRMAAEDMDSDEEQYATLKDLAMLERQFKE
ncbi:hypothetical protein HK101_009535 [Irineochytrium annulatum]|nr:hypothetical protein HK101_009535 [Irineochytrium annulatum]